MSITKPFTFVAGTKARANEVNQNFDVLYSQVNSNISAINTNSNDIDTLDSNKANVNGSSSQRFACADPTSPSDAVNKQSLTKAIGNSINYIDGYVISKDSGSPNDTILVTAGSCYYYTKSVVLAKNTSTTKQNTSQGASTTYYVYVIGSDSGTSVDILISSSAVTPALPEGYTKFRQIGNYTTDSSSNIQIISSYSNSVSATTIVNSITPDYNKGISVSLPYTVTQKGWCVGTVLTGNGARQQIQVNGITVVDSNSPSGGSSHYAWSARGAASFLVSEGDVVTGVGDHEAIVKFFPFKEVI
jgi:hypothetical protein